MVAPVGVARSGLELKLAGDCPVPVAWLPPASPAAAAKPAPLLDPVKLEPDSERISASPLPEPRRPRENQVACWSSGCATSLPPKLDDVDA